MMRSTVVKVHQSKVCYVMHLISAQAEYGIVLWLGRGWVSPILGPRTEKVKRLILREKHRLFRSHQSMAICPLFET
jgi:hypothetical protein